MYAVVKVSIHIKWNQSGYGHNITTVQFVDTYLQKGSPKNVRWVQGSKTVYGKPVNWTKHTILAYLLKLNMAKKNVPISSRAR